MRSRATVCAAWVIAASAWALSAPAVAQDAAADALAAPSAEPANPPSDTPLTPEEAAALGSALLFDPAGVAGMSPVKPLRLPGLSDPTKFDVSRTDRPDGSSTMVVKQPLASEWDAKVGADLNLVPTPPDGYRPVKPLPAVSRDSGVAWASLGVANLATVDARVDPANDQGKLGTTFKQSIPFGEKFSLTLQNSYSVTENFSPPVTTSSDVPLMAAPVATTPPTPQIWGSQKAVKFDILATGTTFGAGVTTASNDPLTHNTLSADQKLYGPLHVTTAVTDLGQPTPNKSIRAGFKLNW